MRQRGMKTTSVVRMAQRMGLATRSTPSSLASPSLGAQRLLSRACGAVATSTPSSAWTRSLVGSTAISGRASTRRYLVGEVMRPMVLGVGLAATTAHGHRMTPAELVGLYADRSWRAGGGVVRVDDRRQLSSYDREEGGALRLYSAEERESRFVIREALRPRGWEMLVVAILVPLTAGLALLLLKPFWDYQAMHRAAKRFRIDGRRLKFTGELRDYFKIYLRDCLYTIVTLGIYTMLDYPEINSARFFDEHLEWDDEPVPQIEAPVLAKEERLA